MGVKVDYRTYKNLRGRSSKREGSPFWVKPKDIHKKKHIFGRFGYSLPLTNPGKKRIKNSFEKQSRIRFFGNKDYLHKLRAKRIKSFQQKSHVLIGKRYVKKVDLASFIARMKKIKKLIKTSRIRFWIRFLAKRFFSNRSFKVFYRAMGLSKLNFMNMIKYLIFSRLIFHKS